MTIATVLRIFASCVLLPRCVFVYDSRHKNKTTFFEGMESCNCDFASPVENTQLQICNFVKPAGYLKCYPKDQLQYKTVSNVHLQQVKSIQNILSQPCVITFSFRLLLHCWPHRVVHEIISD